MSWISRILEISLYSAIIFLPWLMVTYYPFRAKLRFSVNAVALLTAILAIARIAMDLTAGFGGNTFPLQILFPILYILCYAVCIKAHPLEMILNFVLVAALYFATTGIANALFSAVTTNLDMDAYSLPNSLILLGIEGIVTTVDCLLYEPAKAKLLHSSHKFAAIPAEIEDNLDAQEEHFEPESAPQTLPLQKAKKSTSFSAIHCGTEQLLSMQFTSLNTRILESRRLRKNFLVQTDAALKCLEEQNYEKLRAVLLSVRKHYTATSYCAIAAISAPLDYYAQLARSCGIPLDIDVQLSGNDLGAIAPADMIIVLGNLLDNAMDACKSHKSSNRHIHVTISQNSSELSVAVENTCNHPSRQNDSGAYLSSKYDGPGAGLQSVQFIANRYHGKLEISDVLSNFTAKVTLKT